MKDRLIDFSNVTCGALDTSICECSSALLVEIASAVEPAHLCWAIVQIHFCAIAAQFGRFLPRLGPFVFRTAFLYAADAYPRSAELCEIRIQRFSAMH